MILIILSLSRKLSCFFKNIDIQVCNFFIFSLLQKEVKSRIQYIVDVLGKMDTALEQPVIVEKSRTRSPSPKETRRVRKTSTDSENDSSRRKSFKQRKISPSNERSEEIHRRSKSKKKQKASYFVFRKKKCAQFLSFYY